MSRRKRTGRPGHVGQRPKARRVARSVVPKVPPEPGATTPATPLPRPVHAPDKGPRK